MASSGSKIMEFVMLVGRLKATRRTGWVRKGVSAPESIAGHMYRMAVLSMLVDTNANIKKDHCVKMSIVHDLAECLVGDITPSDGVSKEEKYKLEKDAMSKIGETVSPEVAQEFMELWQEYEDQRTLESNFVKDLDKFDMISQAYEYEQMDKKPGFLQEFFDSTKGQFQTPQVKGWVAELEKVRAKTLPSSENKTSEKPTEGE